MITNNKSMKDKLRFPISFQFFLGFFLFGIFTATIVGVLVFLFAYNNYYQAFQEEKVLVAKLSSTIASGTKFKSWIDKNSSETEDYKKYLKFIQEIVNKDKTIAYLFTIYFNEELNEFQYTSSATISEEDSIWVENWSLGFSLIKNNNTWNLYYKGVLVDSNKAFKINKLFIEYKIISSKIKKLIFTEDGISKETILIEDGKVFCLINSKKIDLEEQNLINIDWFSELKEDPLQLTFVKKNSQDIIQGSKFFNNKNFRNELHSFMEKGTDSFKDEFSEFNFGDYIIVTSVIRDEKLKPVGQVILKITRDNLRDFKSQLIKKIFLGTLVSLPISLILIFLFSKFFSKPIGKLKMYSNLISKGNFDKKLYLDRNDEFSDLAESMNQMSEEIKESRDKLENYTESLELKVKERTDALSHTLEAIYRDLNTAKKIQTSILPKLEKVREKISIYSIYVPMSEVGGDIYDIHFVNDRTIRFFIADATGHGVQASLITMAIKTIYDSIKNLDIPASEVMGILNNKFINFYQILFTYFTCGILDLNLESKTISYSGGGHPYPIIVKSDKSVELLKTKGSLLGAKENMNFTLHETTLNQGDEVFLFTDGIFEEWNDSNEEFGVDRLEKTLVKADAELPLKMESVLDTVMKFMENQPIADDICFIGFKLK
ncbi:MAG: SpoIIE family protein phosphatase [Leptospiraceae bacterium]|nr:SpoIIE family protein phosphatase [Leptospiraceae bacterium]